MNPEEALNLLDNVISQVNTNRDNHVKLVEAIQILRRMTNGMGSISSGVDNRINSAVPADVSTEGNGQEG